MKVTDEELKAIFRANDYTTYVPKYDENKATAAENNIHSRAKALFYKGRQSRKSQNFGLGRIGYLTTRKPQNGISPSGQHVHKC